MTKDTKTESYESLFDIKTKSLESIDDEDYYIFIRCYDSKYKSKIDVCSLLDKVIRKFTPPPKSNGITDAYNHAAINYKLTDDFCGLTTNMKMEKFTLKRESCTDPTTVKYMTRTDNNISKFGVYAVKVSKQEYEDTKNFLNMELKDKLMKYSQFNLFLQGIQKLGRKLYTKGQESSDKDVMIGATEQLVCSTFVGYTLYHCTHYKNVFKRYNIDYNYLSPNELTTIPGVIFCFGGLFKDYDIKAKQFIQKNKSFAGYYSKDGMK